MLQVLRDSMKYLAWILWAVIGVFVLYVFVDFGSGVNPGNAPVRAAATVGDEEITYREYEREYRRLEDQFRQQLGGQLTPELAEQLRLPMQALNRLINRKVLLGEAERLDLEVSDKELRAYIVSLPTFQDADGKFAGAEAYERAVRGLGFTPDGFEQEIRQQLLLQRVLGAFERSVVVSAGEVDERYRQQVEKAKLRYVALPFGALASDLQTTDAELQKWFEAHRDQYQMPETRVADYLLIDPRRLQETLQIPEAELRAHYDQNEQEFTEQEQIRARHILVDTDEQVAEAKRRLAAGEDFGAVAAAMSKEPQAAQSRGDLGWFGRGRMVAPFEQAAFGAPVGEVVGPVETEFGKHLIQVQERREAAKRPFAEVREAVRLRLAAERAATQAEEQARALAAEVEDAGGNARQIMQERGGQPGVELGTTEPFTRQGAVPPLGAAPALAAAAFQLPQGGVSDALRTPRGWVVLRVAEVRPPRPSQLAEVRDRVRQDFEQDRLRRLAVERLRPARARLDAGASLEEVAAELGQPVQESQEFGHGTMVPGLGVAPDLVKAVMAQPEGALGGPLAIPGRALVYRVAERKGADPATMAQAKTDLKRQLEEEKVNALLGALVNERKQELGVTYDPQLLEQLGLTGGEAEPG
jgi:peptidyl-prolyl cis-trans isomerase D